MLKTRLDHIDLSALQELAERLAPCLKRGDVLLLQGDLGAGKTQFAKYLIAAMSAAPQDVISPTFTLVQAYETDKGEVWHFDLYRIEQETELEAIGLEDAFHGGISLIEWPERLGRYRPKACLTLDFHINPDQSRKIDITPAGERWQAETRTPISTYRDTYR